MGKQAHFLAGHVVNLNLILSRLRPSGQGSWQPPKRCNQLRNSCISWASFIIQNPLKLWPNGIITCIKLFFRIEFQNILPNGNLFQPASRHLSMYNVFIRSFKSSVQSRLLSRRWICILTSYLRFILTIYGDYIIANLVKYILLIQKYIYKWWIKCIHKKWWMI